MILDMFIETPCTGDVEKLWGVGLDNNGKPFVVRSRTITQEVFPAQLNKGRMPRIPLYHLRQVNEKPGVGQRIRQKKAAGFEFYGSYKISELDGLGDLIPEASSPHCLQVDPVQARAASSESDLGDALLYPDRDGEPLIKGWSL